MGVHSYKPGCRYRRLLKPHRSTEEVCLRNFSRMRMSTSVNSLSTCVLCTRSANTSHSTWMYHEPQPPSRYDTWPGHDKLQL